jgi:hypothetical protein
MACFKWSCLPPSSGHVVVHQQHEETVNTAGCFHACLPANVLAVDVACASTYLGLYCHSSLVELELRHSRANCFCLDAGA